MSKLLDENEILKILTTFRTWIILCSRFSGIANSSDQRRASTGDVVHVVQLLSGSVIEVTPWDVRGSFFRTSSLVK